MMSKLVIYADLIMEIGIFTFIVLVFGFLFMVTLMVLETVGWIGYATLGMIIFGFIIMSKYEIEEIKEAISIARDVE